MTERGAHDVDGGLRCRATGKRCMSHRQAVEMQHAARRRGDSIAALRCELCSWWHVGHNRPVVGNGGRRWRKGASTNRRR